MLLTLRQGVKRQIAPLQMRKNAELGVTKAQEKAMKADSMFGWTVPAADPQSYDENGKLLCSKPKDRGER